MSNSACPFCDEFAKIEIASEFLEDESYVVCKGCGARGPIASNADEAWQMWTKRPEPDQ